MNRLIIYKRRMIMQKIFSIILVASLSFLAHANSGTINISKYKRLKVGKAINNLLTSGNFENGATSWKNIGKAGFQLVKGSGRNSTRGLRLVLSSKRKYTSVGQTFDLKPNTRYRFGAWIKTSGVSRPGASICLEKSTKKDKKWVRPGAYLRNLFGDNDWTLVEGIYVTSSDAPQHRFSIGLYARKGTKSGTVVFDEAFVLEDGGAWNAGIISPVRETISTNNGKIEFASYISGKFDYSPKKKPIFKALATFRLNGKSYSFVAPMKNNRINFDFGRLPAGKIKLKLKLLDVKNHVVTGQKDFEIKIEPAELALKVKIDRNGRMLVDDKPFLPIGLYIGNLSESKIKTIAESPFNCILPYCSLVLKSGSKFEPGLSGIRKALDRCQEKNIKVIFSLKDLYPKGATSYAVDNWNGVRGPSKIAKTIVNALKDHPAILAWYISDELDVAWRKQLIKRRRQVNDLDKDHPTLAIFYQNDKFPHYLNGFDIFGTDSLPIQNENSKNIKRVDELTKAGFDLVRTQNNNGAFWSTVQISNAGCFKLKSRKNLEIYKRDFRSPNYTDMLSMSILEAIYGAKGFLFYNFHDLFRSPDKSEFKRRWPVICKVASELQKLAPYLLGKPIEVKVKTAKGVVRARAFKASDNSICLLVAAIGPGQADAVITIPGNITGLKSLNSMTAELGNSKYHFKGSDNCSDILISK